MPSTEAVASNVTLQLEAAPSVDVTAQVWEVQDSEQHVRMVSAQLPAGVTHLSDIDGLELVTGGELWTPTVAQLNDAVSR